MKRDLIYCGIIFVLLLVVFGRRDEKCPTVTPTESTIIVVGDTASANVWKKEVSDLRKQVKDLNDPKRKIKIKYDTIYITPKPMPVIDSIYESNL